MAPTQFRDHAVSEIPGPAAAPGVGGRWTPVPGSGIIVWWNFAADQAGTVRLRLDNRATSEALEAIARSSSLPDHAVGPGINVALCGALEGQGQSSMQTGVNAASKLVKVLAEAGQARGTTKILE